MGRGFLLDRIPLVMALAMTFAVANAQASRQITPTYRSESKAYIEDSKDGWNYVTVN